MGPRRKSGKKKHLQPGAPWGVIIGSVLVAAGMLALLGYLAFQTDTRSQGANLEADRWQADYWKKPVPLQGEAPPSYVAQAKVLNAENCALCHWPQYEDWRDSLHARAVSPGLTAQFPQMDFAAQAECLACHKPLDKTSYTFTLKELAAVAKGK